MRIEACTNDLGQKNWRQVRPLRSGQVPKRDENPWSPITASDGARAKFQRPACSLQRVEHVTKVFELLMDVFKG